MMKSQTVKHGTVLQRIKRHRESYLLMLPYLLFFTVFTLAPVVVAFVLSSIGMAVPSNGGLGPWNIAIMFGLALYGISEAQGTAFSMLQWSGQTVMLILLGILTMVYIALSRNGKKKAGPENPGKEITLSDATSH